MTTRAAAGIVVWVMVASTAWAQEEFKNPKANIPPKAAPQRRNAGEGVPPLPLPATPLRRSERNATLRRPRWWAPSPFRPPP